MSVVLRKDIDELLQSENGTCVSIYMPTYMAGREVQQNHLRFKNLLHDARLLAEQQDPSGCVNKRLKKLEPLIDNDNFWQHQSRGLALFVDSQRTQLMSVPREFDERLRVGDQFHVLPLLPLLQTNGVYYVLAVSQNECKLYQGSQESLSEVSADLPESLDAVIGAEHHKGFGLHSFRVRPSSSDRAVPHGHFESNDEAEIEQYFREIDEAACAAIPDPDAVLIFAGVEEHFPAYKEVNNHDGLYHEQISGNPEQRSLEELHELAWSLLSEKHEQQIENVLEQLGNAQASDCFSDCVEDILTAARNGRVDTVVTTLQKESNDPTELNSDLEEITNTVLLHGGDVIVVDAEKLHDSQIAAVMRYPAPATT